MAVICQGGASPILAALVATTLIAAFSGTLLIVGGARDVGNDAIFDALTAATAGSRNGGSIAGWTSISLAVSPFIADQLGPMPPRHSTELLVTLVAAAFAEQAFSISTGVKSQAMIAAAVEEAAIRPGTLGRLAVSADSLFREVVSGVGVRHGRHALSR